MSDVNVVATESVTLPADAPAAMSVSDAARMLSEARRAKQEAPPVENAPQATTDEPELAEANAALEGASGEVEAEAQDTEEEATLPPVERPKSWAKELDEEWSSYPRAAQERIAKREQERDSATARSLKEAAELRKTADAELAQYRELTKALAGKLPEMESAVQEYMGRQYPEIRTYDDVVNMARQAEALADSDPFAALKLNSRLNAWREDQQKVALQLQEARQAKQRLEQERGQSILKYQAEETEKLADFHPEVKDPEKLKALTEKAINHLKSFDLSDQQLNEYAAHGEKPFIFSAAFQRILLNSLKYEEVKAAPAKAIPKAIPPVQRPGVAKGGNPSVALQIQNLETQLTKATGTQAIKLAAELTRMKRTVAR